MGSLLDTHDSCLSHSAVLVVKIYIQGHGSGTRVMGIYRYIYGLL